MKRQGRGPVGESAIAAPFGRFGLIWGTNVAGGHGLLAQRDVAVAAARPRSRRRDDIDARRYVRVTLGLTLAIYALLAAALTGTVPAWLPAVILPWIYVRLSLALHELLHVRTADRVPRFHRLAMIFDTPFGLGYRELRSIHFRHHRYAVTERDPELYQIRGGHGRAMLSALFSPERAVFAWIRERGVSRTLLQEGSLRGLLFVGLALLNPLVFLLYWCALRVCIGASSFVFHHLLHSRDDRPGTFALPAPQWLVRVGVALFGDESMRILTQHRSHHLWPDLRAADLPQLPAGFALPPGRTTAAQRAAASCCTAGARSR